MTPEAATRLCSACGMCCNGVMFHRVRLQSRDTKETLVALGRDRNGAKKNGSIIQPCPAHGESGCTIYGLRPRRCRDFVCRLLQEVENRTIDETVALDRIQEAQTLVRQIRELFRRAEPEEEETSKSFVSRFSAILGQPLRQRSDPESLKSRQQLIDAYAQLEQLLSTHFRTKNEEPTPTGFEPVPPP